MVANTRFVTVASRKGGSAKTTTAANLAAALVERGRSVLLVDADSSGQAADLLGVEWMAGRPVFASFLAGLPLPECVIIPASDRPGLLLLPGDDQTLAAERSITSSTIPIGVRALRSAAAALGVDYVIIDAPPRGAAQDYAIACADLVVVPVVPAAMAVSKAIETVDLVQAIGDRYPLPGRPAGHVARVLALPVVVDSRTRDGRSWISTINSAFSGMLAPCSVPARVAVVMAATIGRPLVWSDPESDPAVAYLTLAGWVDRDLVPVVETAAAGGA